jgi:hypothetical protein
MRRPNPTGKAASTKPLPKSDETLLVRTDFSDAAVWTKVCAEVRVPGPDLQGALGLLARMNEAIGQPLGKPEIPLRVIDDPQSKDLPVEQLLKLLPQGPHFILLLVADRLTFSHPDRPVLVVDVGIKPGRTFRSVPSQVFAIESNLSIANMDWEDFSGSVDEDGVFRGFPK